MKDIVIIGTEDLAQVADYYFTEAGRNVTAFTVDAAYLKEPQFFGRPVLPLEELERTSPPDTHEVFVAIGSSRLNRSRTEKFQEMRGRGYTMASYIHPTAQTWSGFRLKENCFILENVILQPFCSVGENVVIWSGTHVGHHSSIANNCFITSHCVISGNVHIGAYSFVGVNATMRNDITIGERCIIGAGVLLLENAADGSVYGGKGVKPALFDSSRIKDI